MEENNKENQNQNQNTGDEGQSSQTPQQSQSTAQQGQQGQQQAAPNQVMNLPSVPNATAVLVLGILSIVFCWCYGVVGATLGIIALVLAKKGKEAYKTSPNSYSVSSYNNLKAGRVCGIIGICLSGVVLVYYIIAIAFYGAMISSMPWEEIMNQSSY